MSINPFTENRPFRDLDTLERERAVIRDKIATKINNKLDELKCLLNAHFFPLSIHQENHITFYCKVLTNEDETTLDTHWNTLIRSTLISSQFLTLVKPTIFQWTKNIKAEFSYTPYPINDDQEKQISNLTIEYVLYNQIHETIAFEMAINKVLNPEQNHIKTYLSHLINTWHLPAERERFLEVAKNLYNFSPDQMEKLKQVVDATPVLRSFADAQVLFNQIVTINTEELVALLGDEMPAFLKALEKFPS